MVAKSFFFVRASIILAVAIACSARASEATALTAAIIHSAAADSQHVRFIWLQTAVQPEIVDLAMNLACPTQDVGDIVRGQVISDEVIAYDLAHFDPVNPDRLVQLWDSLAMEDPIFHVSKQLQEGQPVAILAPHLADLVAEDITNQQDKRLDVILAELSESPAPILEARFLIEQLLDRRYYEFRGLKAGDYFLNTIDRSGFYPNTAIKTDAIRANYLIRSQITGDQRVIAAVFGLASPTPATITYDLFDENDDPENQFVRNLDRFSEVADGSEAFVPMANGLIEFMLIDGQGKLVAEAPPNLAVDHTKPEGHDAILRPAVSCLACHTIAGGSGMYRDFANDYERLPVAGLSIESQAKLQKVYGRSIDEPDGILGRARRDFIVALSPLSGIDEGSDNALIQSLVTTVRDYRYGMLSAKQQAAELGLPGEASIGSVVQLTDGEVVDPEVYLAVEGVPLSRESWNTIRVELASRYYQSQSQSESQ